MTTRAIQFTRGPQKSLVVGKQFFWESIDLGGDLRVLDLTLSVLSLAGGVTPTFTVAVLTSVQDDTEDGWATLGTFPQVNAQTNGPDQTIRQVMVGALRYVRFHVTELSAGATCHFTIEGEARTVE